MASNLPVIGGILIENPRRNPGGSHDVAATSFTPLVQSQRNSS
jgi:hypothetical protein